MQNRIIWIALAAILAPSWAQDPPTPRPDAEATLRALNAEKGEIVKAWRQSAEDAAKAAEAAKSSGLPIPALPMRPDFTALRDKYVEASKASEGEAAVGFLMTALALGGKQDQSRGILDLLLDEHLDSPELGGLGGMMGHLSSVVGETAASAAKAKIRAHGKNHVLMGYMALQDNEAILRKEPPSSTAFALAKTTVASAVEKALDADLRERFDSLLIEVEKFGIGLIAPDISGIDLDAAAFKLSDYKGKILFVDFWGDW